MFKEVTSEIKELSQDLCFVRNLSLLFILAIAGLFSLADLQTQNTKLSEQAAFQDMSQSVTKFMVER
ncbi:MAG: hypothetical protein AAGE96_20420 [Cyanobacteria bacterium P01_G01_bin.19]